MLAVRGHHELLQLLNYIDDQQMLSVGWANKPNIWPKYIYIFLSYTQSIQAFRITLDNLYLACNKNNLPLTEYCTYLKPLQIILFHLYSLILEGEPAKDYIYIYKIYVVCVAMVYYGVANWTIGASNMAITRSETKVRV